MGRARAPLRRENVLIVGSGGLVHNLHRLRYDSLESAADPWAMQFDLWVRERVAGMDVAALAQYRRQAPHALEAVPTPEHFLPLFFVLGTLEPGDRVYDVFEGFRYGSLSMYSFVLAGRPTPPRSATP
jgi:4,5-DOPA dioxygenase extradiol